MEAAGTVAPVRLAVLASGTGTLLEAILADGLEVVLVVVDRPCRAVEVSEAAGVPVAQLLRDSFGKDFHRPAYTERVIAALEDTDVDLVAIAGFGTVLSPAFVEAFSGRVLNTHPSLLPAFPGAHAPADAIAHGAKVTGVTVHFVDATLDGGPIIAQRALAIEDGDDAVSLHRRIQRLEHQLLPEVVAQLARGQLLCEGRAVRMVTRDAE